MLLGPFHNCRKLLDMLFPCGIVGKTKAEVGSATTAITKPSVDEETLSYVCHGWDIRINLVVLVLQQGY